MCYLVFRPKTANSTPSQQSSRRAVQTKIDQLTTCRREQNFHSGKERRVVGCSCRQPAQVTATRASKNCLGRGPATYKSASPAESGKQSPRNNYTDTERIAGAAHLEWASVWIFHWHAHSNSSPHTARKLRWHAIKATIVARGPVEKHSQSCSPMRRHQARYSTRCLTKTAVVMARDLGVHHKYNACLAGVTSADSREISGPQDVCFVVRPLIKSVSLCVLRGSLCSHLRMRLVIIPNNYRHLM